MSSHFETVKPVFKVTDIELEIVIRKLKNVLKHETNMQYIINTSYYKFESFKNVLARLIDTALQNFIAMLYNVPQKSSLIFSVFSKFRSYDLVDVKISTQHMMLTL